MFCIALRTIIPSATITIAVYKAKTFARFAGRENLTDTDLAETVRRAERGLIDADLGGGIIKQRVPRRGQGRSGGYRTLIVYRSGALAVFLFGFAKNERANVSSDELTSLRSIGAQWLADHEKVARDVAAKTLIKVAYADES